jgi:hypothetical protein
VTVGRLATPFPSVPEESQAEVEGGASSEEGLADDPGGLTDLHT